ncbi:MAG: DUF2480 family protein [Chitinophagaceae bacterium]
MENIIVNKVAQSSIVTLNLEDFLPKQPIKIFDLKDFLFMGLILKEKDYRAALEIHDWSDYNNKNIAITCSADAIVPMWAYMLATQYLQPITASVSYGTESEVKIKLLVKNIDEINANEYIDKRVVVKGCGDEQIPAEAYVAITSKLKPVVKSIMFGEPCSTVPIYKKGKV